MSRWQGQHIGLGVALLTTGVGVALALQALFTLSSDLHRLDRKMGDLATLKKIQADWKANQQVLQPFEALASPHPVVLTELAAKNLPGITPSIRQRESIPAMAGWVARHTEVKCEVTPADLGKFLLAAESARPPWRLVEFDLSTSATAAGTIRAALVLEALEKK